MLYIFAINIPIEIEELLILLINLLYNILMTASKWQATIGKVILKMKIVDQHYNRLTLLHAFARAMAYYFSYITMGLGFLMIAFTKRGLHDKISNSFVIYNK